MSALSFRNHPSITVDRNGGLFSPLPDHRGLTLLLVATIGRQMVPFANIRSNSPSPVQVTGQVDTVRQGDTRMINQYRIHEQIGRGQHGEVWLCVDIRDNDKQVVCCMSPAPHPLCSRFSPSNTGDEDHEEVKPTYRQAE